MFFIIAFEVCRRVVVRAAAKNLRCAGGCVQSTDAVDDSMPVAADKKATVLAL